MSRSCLNFFLIFKLTQFVVHLPSRACYRRRFRLGPHVSTIICIADCLILKITADYASKFRGMNHPLRLLTENEIFRLNVWANPTNDPKLGTDLIGTTVTEVLSTPASSFRN